MKPILQTESSECGLACLAMVASHFGSHMDLADLRRRFSISLKGASLAQLMRHAGAMHLASRPLRLALEELGALKCPCILHWNLNHFVVLKKIKRSLRGATTVVIFDPAVGERILTMAEVSDHFTGVALELLPTAQFEQKDATRRMSIKQLTGPVVGLRRALLQVFALALALEVFALVSPLFNQYVIDEVIVSGDHQLLQILLAGFALLLVTQTLIGIARSMVLMRWSIDVGLQWSARVFSHLISLPTVFFEKRHLGDVLSRFGSIAAIQQTLTSVFVESALDGLMALLALGMMLMYSAELAVIVALSVVLYAALRWIFYQPLRAASQERLILAAKENTHFVETVRAIVPLKLFGRDAERKARWQNLKQDVANRDARTEKLTILIKAANSTIIGLQGLIVFYVGAGLVLQNALTVGMLMAFISYAATFAGRMVSLVDMLINLKMLGLHAERLSDIVLEPAEPTSMWESDVSRISPSITLRDVKFRYADGEPWILDGVNLHIPAGQSVALVGPSGCGKTTMCKILLGLLAPTEGEVMIDGIPIQQLGMQAYRQLVGTVMQDDVLLAGSIIDNIGFFDSKCEYTDVERCARLAAVHDEIVAMPMGYQTLVGDMGSSLSGGQKQRVLLARALYKSPKVLALDEATSHLDIQNEQLVNAALSAMQLTRIMVAHRPETINSADRVVCLHSANITELRSPASPAQFHDKGLPPGY
ncbi:peptidase domain-containing ABC transporter [Massilia antarctica]|uniref:peptidase domain-containing ABC transporter n=1 Tax=Massilia antarctica TaxID=2765360 RepID=UPI0006BB6B27|nr:peptidase domain-containing ABC transporter [Massilia sp. H27-R4]MCY0913017.1 peptidase domain-containing ABC transporter [Massilia sp. H27-R4]CUI07598.1 Type I secretion system ATPase, LssB family LapB [Janthinobacterium sp. CG23_2]CUU31384.1 Type I secretion system ATPase, LssB family LapB [Janthinobacterium sp. CG23_2]